MSRLRSATLLLVVVIAAGLTAGCRPASLVSTQDEIEVGRSAAAQIEREYTVVTDPAVNRLVDGIGQNLAAQAAQREGITYKFGVLQDQSVNAFALPGGWIYLYSGLIDAVGNDQNVLAAVIAHEIGHVAARHHAEMMGRSAIYGIAVGVLTSGNVQQWANVFANLTLLRWSRKHELESDRLAVEYTYRSGRYQPEGVVRLLQLLQEKGGESRFLPFLQTHPLTGDRVERAQYWIQYYRQGGVR